MSDWISVGGPDKGQLQARRVTGYFTGRPAQNNRHRALKPALETDDTTHMLSLRPGTRSPCRDEAHRDSGAAVVEMAFIFSLLIMLLVGVVTSATAFGQKNSIENAAREASRYAATLPEAWDNLDDVVSVAVEAAQGDLDADVDGQYICVAHTGHNQKLVVIGGVPTGPSGGTCYPDGLSDSRVQVETRRQSQINAALFSVDLNLTATASARYERAES
jgi:hypothetical protein